jgi:hypothetical protein
MYAIYVHNRLGLKVKHYSISDAIEAYDLYYGLWQGRNTGDVVSLKSQQGYLLDEYACN